VTVADVVHQDDPAEVALVARGIASAVAPPDGLTPVQIALLGSVTAALTGTEIDYGDLEPLGPEELAGCLAAKPDAYRHRIVHHMVLGELVLRPLPIEVSYRVSQYADALGVHDDFVRVARRYSQGAYGLAWQDLQRNGFADHLVDAGGEPGAKPRRAGRDPFARAEVDDDVANRWRAFEDLDEGTLGRAVYTMYDERGFCLPGTAGGAPIYLAQHDFVHVLADYGTNLQGELEVFSLIARADPDPKGFAWVATLFGLFETGYIADTGFFVRDTDGGHHAEGVDMGRRLADAIIRGKAVCERTDTDLFELDYYALATRPLDDVRDQLGVPAKSKSVVSPGTFDLEGMSESQQRVAAARRQEAT
jgi:hypothetical protein